MDTPLPTGWSLLTLVDALLVFTALEIMALWAWHRVTGRGIALREVWATLLAGAMLMLALRCALTPGGTLPTLVCLAAAGLGHAIDLRRRLRARTTLRRPADAMGSFDRPKPGSTVRRAALRQVLPPHLPRHRRPTRRRCSSEGSDR